ncbi:MULTISPECIES: GGDEF domain-containing response regulator [Clostridium]|uniref:GGDEF domain-containing response regulator n=1 Tax=Clostridium TaxID=1485 RepID=UPI0003F5D7EB|nr:diguanylate cyclase [Clostridium cadaveris]MDU4952981.1 diguanylate cyclase [Clostridium sp.]UFH65092.1 GGDEF domain-containing response regulator [Clostridium cadaveris]
MITLQKILIVDNNKLNRKILKEALNDYIVMELEDAKIALNNLKNSKEEISAIFLDVNMLIIDGNKFIHKLRSIPKFSTVPVIATISDDDEHSISKALDCGVNDLIKKPFKHDVIRKRLDNTLLLQKALLAAQTDPLTTLLNRTSFEKYVEDYFKNKDVKEKNAALFMIDIDNFKQLNDTFGHVYGDSVLKKFSQILSNSTNDTSVLCRMGGDEFMVLLKDIPNIEYVEKIAYDILRKLSSLEVIPNAPSPTCSIGISIAPKDGKSIRDLYFCADEALYKAKQKGKHQYSFYGLSHKLEKRNSWMNKEWILDEQDSYIYICDAETHEVYYLNLKSLKLLNSAPPDSPKCLCYLLGLHPNAFTFCSEQPLKGNDLYTNIYKSCRTGEILLYKGKLIDWNGRVARMGIVTVISSEDDKKDLIKSFN